jgi:hypothetical protein
MKAKTYQSTNNWSAPQSLSTFGIPIIGNRITKYLGLEEFNFSQKVMGIEFENKKLAYIPSFSEKVRPDQTELDLFYSAGNNVTMHYATLYGVQQIENIKGRIEEIRKILNQENFISWVKNNQEFNESYGGLFDSACDEYEKFFNVNRVIASGHEDRFVFNVFYEKVFFHNPETQVPWANYKRARHLYL